MSEEQPKKDTTMKGRLGDKYDQWYKRHRLVENQRVWRKVMEENPMNTVPEYERQAPEGTYDLVQAFYHVPDCPCGSCVGSIGKLAKTLHALHFKSEPWFRGAARPLPELPDQILRLLQDVEEAVRSHPDLQTLPPLELD